MVRGPNARQRRNHRCKRSLGGKPKPEAGLDQPPLVFLVGQRLNGFTNDRHLVVVEIDLFDAIGFAIGIGIRINSGARTVCLEQDFRAVEPAPPIAIHAGRLRAFHGGFCGLRLRRLGA